MSDRRRRVARLRLLAATVPAAMVLAWSAGFAWFVHVAWMRPSPPPRADGIVALTGGAARVETALQLLVANQARLLLISGVGGPTELPSLARRAGLEPGLDPALSARVTLGRAATSTLGNARETADWARNNGLRSLLVVTAFYHMPRALAELGRAAPDIRLHPVPVTPPGMAAGVKLRLLASEYTKFLVTAAGLRPLTARDQNG